MAVPVRVSPGAASLRFLGVAAALAALWFVEAFLLEEGLLFIRKSKRLSTITTHQFFRHISSLRLRLRLTY